MWGKRSALDDPALVWDRVPAPKHQLSFEVGAHWGFLSQTGSECAIQPGNCAEMEAIAADLTALFIGRAMPTPLSGVDDRWIPPSLEPRELSLTTEQQRYAGGHLISLDRITFTCALTLAWDTPEGSGLRREPL